MLCAFDMSGDAGRRLLDSSRDREAADEKPRRRGSRPSGAVGGGSKKSTRRKFSSRAAAPAVSGGERAREHGSDEPRRESGGLAARPDLTPALAQDKGSARPAEAGSSRARPGAKGVRRRFGSTDRDGGQGNAALGEERHQRTQRDQPVAETELGGGGGGVDRAILQK